MTIVVLMIVTVDVTLFVDFSVSVVVARVEIGTRVPNVVTGERRYSLPYAGIGL